MRNAIQWFGVWCLAAMLLSACSSDDSPSGPTREAAPWSGEVQVLDAAGAGLPGLLVQIEYATEDLPKKARDVGEVASATIEAYTDHDGIARSQTVELSDLWIHRLRVSDADGGILTEQALERTDQQSLGEVEVLSYLFTLGVSVDHEISASRDSIAAQSIIGTWRTAFVDDGTSFERRLVYSADGRFSGVLTQSGNEFSIAGTWVVRNLILTTAFIFNGNLERHSTRFEVAGARMTTARIPAGTPRQWDKQ